MVLKKAKGFGNSSLEVSEIITIIDPETLPVGTCQVVSQLHTHTHTHTHTHPTTNTTTKVQAQGIMCSSVKTVDNTLGVTYI